jgi:aspartyl-tRNA(Asn)/glutamyl-tRNA(Gln) amidotransferase subunit A
MSAARRSDIWAMSAADLVRGFGLRQFSPVEALASIEARIDAVNPALNAVIAEDRPAAHRAAEASTRRWADRAPLSPLDGVPLTVKDNLFVAGLPASWGSRAYAGFVPAADEPAVARLRAAGAVVLGKTNVPEFTVEGFTANLLFGVTSNPIAPGRTPGGSSGGAAAAAASGMGPLAIGTDGGGSLRRPAAHCGLYALKPSTGAIPRFGGFRQILADFEVVGPLGRTLADLVTAFALMRGAGPRDAEAVDGVGPGQSLGNPPRIGFFTAVGTAPVDRRIVKAIESFAGLLAEAGCVVREIAAPFDAERTAGCWSTIAAAGLAWEVERLGARAAVIGDNAREMAGRGAAISTSAYLDALQTAATVRHEAAAVFDRFDLLLCPSAAALAWPAGMAFPPLIDGREAGPRGHAVFTAWMNVAGLPAVNLPLARLPGEGGIGVQVVAGPGRDRALLELLLNLEPVTALGAASLPEDVCSHG